MVILIGLILSGSVQVFAVSDGWMTYKDVKIEAYCVIDGDTGEVIMEHNADVRRANASTTKVMTALTLINDKNYDPDRILHVSKQAVTLSDPKSARIKGLKGGDTIRTLDAMAALLIASANDVARVIAQNYGGAYGAIDPDNLNDPDKSQRLFAKKMNEQAKALGLKNTHFTNPAGFDEPDKSHYTTARDLAYITREAMKHPQIAHIVGMQRYRLPPTKNHKDALWAPMANSNSLVIYGAELFESKYFARYTGVKTGTTPQAGRCLVGSGVTHDGRTIICAALGIYLPSRYLNNQMYWRAVPVRALMEEGAKRLGCPAIERGDLLIPTTVTTTPIDATSTPEETEPVQPVQSGSSAQPSAIATVPGTTGGNGIVGMIKDARALPVAFQVLIAIGLLAILFLLIALIVGVVRGARRGRRRVAENHRLDDWMLYEEMKDNSSGDDIRPSRPANRERRTSPGASRPPRNRNVL